MKKIFILSLIVSILSLIPFGTAITNQTCISPNLLNSSTIILVNNTPTTIMENITCDYGCEKSVNGTGRCLELTQSSFSIPIVWITGSILFAVFGMFLKNENLSVLKTVFFFMSIWFLLNTISVLLNMAYISSFASAAVLRSMAIGIKVITYLLYASFVLYFGMFVINLVKWIATIKNKRSKSSFPKLGR